MVMDDERMEELFDILAGCGVVERKGIGLTNTFTVCDGMADDFHAVIAALMDIKL